MINSVKGCYKEKKAAVEKPQNFLKEGCKLYSYDCHDLKMTYTLLGHVSYSNINNGYLLCGCEKGIGARKNREHTCNVISDADHLKYYNLAQKRYQKFFRMIQKSNTMRLSRIFMHGLLARIKE